MIRFLKTVNIIVRAVLVAACLALCAYNVYILVARYAFGNGMPTVFGYAGASVVSGSMDDDSGDDDIEVGDFVIIRAQSDYAVDDVITFLWDGVYITHRIESVTAQGFVTHGDANGKYREQPDRSAVVGKVVRVLKGAGGALEFFRSPAGLLVAIGAGVLVWIGADIVSGLIEKKDDEKEQD